MREILFIEEMSPQIKNNLLRSGGISAALSSIAGTEQVVVVKGSIPLGYMENIKYIKDNGLMQNCNRKVLLVPKTNLVNPVLCVSLSLLGLQVGVYLEVSVEWNKTSVLLGNFRNAP